MYRSFKHNTIRQLSHSITTKRAIHISPAVFSSPSNPRDPTEYMTRNTTSDTAQTQPGMNMEKAQEELPDPMESMSGKRTYVVSEPDPKNTPHDVPSGAFPSSGLYKNFESTDRPPDFEMSSTSSSPAHPVTTKATMQNPEGVGESAAVRYREAPREMGKKGGSDIGAGMMDSKSTSEGRGRLGDRNPPPLQGEATKFSKAGVDNAWKERK